MHAKKGVLVFILLLLVTTVYATEEEGVIATQKVIKDKALIGDDLIFDVTVENPKNYSDSFRFYSPLSFFEWTFRMEPNTLQIDAESSKEVRLYIVPYDPIEVKPGNYAVTLHLVSTNYSDVETVQVFNVELLSYEQAIDVDLELPSKIDTAQDNLFRVTLSNNYEFNVRNLSVALESDYFYKESKPFDLYQDPVTNEYLVNFGDEIVEGENALHVLVYRDGEVVMDKLQMIDISPSGNVREMGSPEKGFLYSKETIEIINDKNAVSYESVSKKLSGFQKLFTTVNEEPTSIEKTEGYYLYTWDFALEPGEGKAITIETNYRGFALGLIGVILIIWLLYIFFKKDIMVSKRITSVQHSKENISTISVLLLVKNKSMGKIRNVKLLDGMSNVIERPTNFGSLAPNKVLKMEKGTKLYWEIPVINGGDEIAISYTVKVKAKVLGQLHIPTALAKYVKNKRRRVVRSNKVTMFS